MRTLNPLARARGLGSAREGVHHWYLQRASALLLVVLTGWLFYAMISLAGAGYDEVVAFMSRPWNTAGAVLFVVAGLYHAMLSIQVIIEDYIHMPALEWSLLFAVKGLSYAAMAVGVIYILRIAAQ